MSLQQACCSPLWRATTTFVIAVAATSCSRDAPEGAFAVRDSGGVQIVSNPSAVRGDSTCPRVASVPTLTIGGVAAEGPYDLLHVRGALRLRDGGVVVLNAATLELRFFDAQGHYVRALGRAGSGPGEFRDPGSLRWFGPDTLMVADYTVARITLVRDDGSLLGTIGLSGSVSGSLLGRLEDGSFVFSLNQSYRPGGATGVRRDPSYLVRVARDGALLDTIGVFSGPEVVIEGDASRMRATNAPFGHRTYFAVGGGRLFSADNAEYRVRVLANGRRLERIIERASRPHPVRSADIRRERAAQAGGSRETSWLSWLDSLYRRERLPASMPMHGAVLLDAAGWLWIRAYSPSDDGGVDWDVFDPTGRLRCAVVLPSALAVREIGRDYVVGVLSDTDDVEQVLVFGLHRNREGRVITQPGTP